MTSARRCSNCSFQNKCVIIQAVIERTGIKPDAFACRLYWAEGVEEPEGVHMLEIVAPKEDQERWVGTKPSIDAYVGCTQCGGVDHDTVMSEREVAAYIDAWKCPRGHSGWQKKRKRQTGATSLEVGCSTCGMSETFVVLKDGCPKRDTRPTEAQRLKLLNTSLTLALDGLAAKAVCGERCWCSHVKGVVGHTAACKEATTAMNKALEL